MPRCPCTWPVVKIGTVQLDAGGAVLPLVLGGQRELLDDLPAIVQPEHAGTGPHADPGDRLVAGRAIDYSIARGC